jgi:hypothetical protein
MNTTFPYCDKLACQANNLGRCTLTVCNPFIRSVKTYYDNKTTLNKEYIQCPHCGQLIEKK